MNWEVLMKKYIVLLLNLLFWIQILFASQYNQSFSLSDIQILDDRGYSVVNYQDLDKTAIIGAP